MKRAINRYGTLPKGARIGAYLESLRQSGSTGTAASPAVTVPTREVTPVEEARSLSPRTARAQPHMIRSNSSGGVTAPTPASPRASRAQPPLRSFTSSPAKPRPRVAELEFPPPPPDLPPPPEDIQPPPPPPPPEIHAESLPDTPDVTDKLEITTSAAPLPEPDEKPPKQSMKEMLELKLVAEIKERADKKKQKVKESPPPNETIETSTSFGDPVTRLVSELSESLNMEALRRADKKSDAPLKGAEETKETVSPIDLKAGLRKTTFTNNVDQKKTELASKAGTDFKSQLKKVDTNKKTTIVSKESDEAGRSIIDFKSRLRKVDSGTAAPSAATNGTAKKDQNSPEREGAAKNRQNKGEGEGGSREASGGEDDDKRRSTGSISSLKKLWESKEADERLSPKARPRAEADSGEASPEERNIGGMARGLRRDDKPSVPNKPAMRGKPITKGGIYATPQMPPTGTNADDAEEADPLVALRTSLEWCTNEVCKTHSSFIIIIYAVY